METKRYQSLFDGSDADNRWPQIPTMEYCGDAEDSSLTGSDILMDIVNVSCPSGSPANNCKDNDTKKEDQPMFRHSQNQPFVPPHFNNSLHGQKQEMDSKALSKTVAESMGLYMDAIREAEYAFNQQGGNNSPGKMYPACARPLEDPHCGTTKSPNMKPFGFDQSSGSPGVCTPGNPAASALVLASPLSSSPQTFSSISSPGGSNNMVSSTTSPPACFGLVGSSVNSPVSQTSCAASLANIKHRNSAACSPVESTTVGSPPIASPLNVMRSPMSSPQSMSSVRSPLSCSNSCNMRSSVSSPAGGSCTSTTNDCNTVTPSVPSPATGSTLAVSSPQNPSPGGFAMPSPAGGLGLVQNDTNSPEATTPVTGTEFKNFQFPKVDMVDGKMFNIGLDQMGMVKYIKNEPGTDIRSMCLGSSKCNANGAPFITQIKNEPNTNEGCMNQQAYNDHSQSLGLFPVSDTTYLSLRNNIDKYSLSGILGPPVSMDGDYDPDMFSNNVLSKEVKQETTDSSYYQENPSMPTSAIVGVNSGGHSFHYQIGAKGTMSFTRHGVRDLPNPLLNPVSPVTALMESWKNRSAILGRGEGYLGQNMPR